MPLRLKSASRRLLRAVPSDEPAPSGPRLDDEALIGAIERGESGVGRALYDRLIRVVDATLLSVVRRRDQDYDDLLQSALEQIVTTIARKKYARACNLNSWAVAVTCHVGLNALRSRTTRRRYLDTSPAGEQSIEQFPAPLDVEGQVHARRAFDRVRSHLAAMNQGQVEALLLHDMMGHDLAEIAAVTGVSVAAAQSRLVRGRTDLKRRLEKDAAFRPEKAR